MWSKMTHFIFHPSRTMLLLVSLGQQLSFIAVRPVFGRKHDSYYQVLSTSELPRCSIAGDVVGNYSFLFCLTLSLVVLRIKGASIAVLVPGYSRGRPLRLCNSQTLYYRTQHNPSLNPGRQGDRNYAGCPGRGRFEQHHQHRRWGRHHAPNAAQQ